MTTGMRTCSGCGEEKAATNFTGELCGACFVAGVSFPDQGDRKEETMPRGVSQKMPCAKGCGLLLMAQHRVRHEAVCDGHGNPNKGKHRPKAPTTITKDKMRKRRATPNVQTSDHANGTCGPDCLLRDLDGAVARALLTEAIRGGMTLEGAAAFVRRALTVRPG